jgi:predicted small secreted protein
MRNKLIVILLCLLLVGCNKFKGMKGDTGETGKAGINGADGLKGDKGDTGSGIMIATYDGTVNSDTIYIHCDQLTASTPVEVYLGMNGYENWMPVECSGIVWYYINLTDKTVVIKNANCSGWNKFRVYAYLPN